MANNLASFSTTNGTWIFLCTAIALLIAFAVWRSSERPADENLEPLRPDTLIS